MALSHSASRDDAPDGPITVCPKCRGRMRGIKAGGVLIDKCDRCGGIWLDALEKDRLLKDRKAVDAVDTGGDVPKREVREMGIMYCPRDHGMMIKMTDLKQAHIRYEGCTVCGGVFLDAGELKDLSEYTLGERLQSWFG